MPDKIKRIRLIFLMAVFIFTAVVRENVSLLAQGNQVSLITTEEQKDLAVLFTFDQEIVDIVFVSPSGQKKYAQDSDVEYVSGDLWCTYRIMNAEAGEWSVEYSLGANSEIGYSIIEDDEGLWLQYVRAAKAADDMATISFEADYKTAGLYYDYEIYAISTTDTEVMSKVSSGRANSNENVDVEVDLSALSSDIYVFRVDVFCEESDVELFDNMLSENYEYINSNTPEMIENYAVRIDKTNLFCDIDWNEFAINNCESYRIIVKADGNVIYKNDMDYSETSDSVGFDSTSQSLEISLAYSRDGIMSEYRTKTIDLNAEELRTDAVDVTGAAQIGISYKLLKERMLHVEINEKKNDYSLKEDGMLAFDLEEGSNHVYAEMELDDLVYCIIDTDIYRDVNPPMINLFDNLDGKTFFENSVTIMGKLTGGSILKIDGEKIELNEDGTFSYDVSLSNGENVIKIEAEDENGNASSRLLTLYKKSNVGAKLDPENKAFGFVPFFGALIASLVIVIWAFIFMKNKEKTEEVKDKKHTIIPFILCDILSAAATGIFIWQYVVRYSYNTSDKYLALAEKSASKAAKYLKIEDACKIGFIVSGTILLFSILFTVVHIIIKKKNKKIEDSGN